MMKLIICDLARSWAQCVIGAVDCRCCAQWIYPICLHMSVHGQGMNISVSRETAMLFGEAAPTVYINMYLFIFMYVLVMSGHKSVIPLFAFTCFPTWYLVILSYSPIQIDMLVSVHEPCGSYFYMVGPFFVHVVKCMSKWP